MQFAGLVAVVGAGWLLAAPHLAPGAKTQRDWVLQMASRPAGAQSSVLLDVSCPMTDGCIAVGDYVDRAGRRLALVERWDGRGWAIMTTPHLLGTSASTLSSVSCSSIRECLALGSYRDRDGALVALAMRLGGGRWVAQQPALANQAQLFDVSCPTDRTCLAVGTDGPKHSAKSKAGDHALFAELWTPTGWAALPTPSAGPDSHSYFAGVSCTSATSCMAVGYTDGGRASTCPYHELALAEHWNGRAWATPRGWESCFGELSDVSCISASACMVVGGSDFSGNSLPIVSLIGARPGGPFNISNDGANQALNEEHWWRVSCASAAACEAIVGAHATLVGLADRVWSIEPEYPTHMTLTNISCTSSKMCVGVGRYHQQAASTTPAFQP